MNLRLATLKDVPAILDIFNDALIHTTAVYSYVPATLLQQGRWFIAKEEKGIPVYVAEDDHGILGFITYGLFRERPAYQYTVELSVYVHPQHRHEGVAKVLMKKMLEVCEAKQFKTLICGIDSENTASIALCQKFGFTHSGTIRQAGYKFGRWLDLAFYQLELPGPTHPLEK